MTDIKIMQEELAAEVRDVLTLIASNNGYGIINIIYKEGAIYEVAVTLTKRGKVKKTDASVKTTL
jgi:hypothetical protein